MYAASCNNNAILKTLHVICTFNNLKYVFIDSCLRDNCEKSTFKLAVRAWPKLQGPEKFKRTSIFQNSKDCITCIYNPKRTVLLIFIKNIIIFKNIKYYKILYL